MKQFIPALEGAKKVFKKRPKEQLNNEYGICHYLNVTHGIAPNAIKIIMGVVPGIKSNTTCYMFANDRSQQIISRWQWRKCRERSKWCKKAIKELER